MPLTALAPPVCHRSKRFAYLLRFMLIWPSGKGQDMKKDKQSKNAESYGPMWTVVTINEDLQPEQSSLISNSYRERWREACYPHWRLFTVRCTPVHSQLPTGAGCRLLCDIRHPAGALAEVRLGLLCLQIRKLHPHICSFFSCKLFPFSQ